MTISYNERRIETCNLHSGDFPSHSKNMYWIIIHSASADASADLSADMPENRLIKLKIILKHSRML